MGFPNKISINANFWKMLGAVATIAMVSYAFYYDTNKTLETNTKSIEAIQHDIDEMSEKVNDTYIFKGVSEGQMGTMREDIKSIEQKQDMMIKMLAEYIMNKND
ncbi:MAG: hypothetical protein ACTSPC_13205 [Candidatus Heimdallarchaeota archaeon]